MSPNPVYLLRGASAALSLPARSGGRSGVVTTPPYSQYDDAAPPCEASTLSTARDGRD